MNLRANTDYFRMVCVIHLMSSELSVTFLYLSLHTL